MRMRIEEARTLAENALAALGYTGAEAEIVADHLIDCELRGLHYGGMPRLVSIAERLRRTGPPTEPIAVTRETPVSALVDGKDHVGYLVAHRAMEIAIEKASAMGVAVVGGKDTWYTGMLSYFAEMAAARGLVSTIASNATPWVAPHGATEGRFGTNPVCYGFPSEDDPVIWDIGTSAIMHAEIVLARRLGEPLPEGVAWDSGGRPTTDPDAALAGAFAAWGGHKGSGLGHVVQLLGAMAGSPVLPPDLAGFGFTIVAMKPGLFGPEAEFRAKVSAYAEAVRAARPVEGGAPARMPFDRSAAERRRRLAEDSIEVPGFVRARLAELAGV